MNNAVGRGLAQRLAALGISSLASGIPIRPIVQRCGGERAIAAAYFGTADVVGPSNSRRQRAWRRSIPAIPTARRQHRSGEKILDLNCISRAGVRQERRSGAAVQHPHADADEPRPDGVQELRDHAAIRSSRSGSGSSTSSTRRLRTPTSASDINLTLDTTCNVQVDSARRHRRHARMSATRPRASTTRSRPRTTSARSTSSAVTASIEFVLKYDF